ncbi:hypothetical protein [Collimonas antrihumi]|uniref:hypothetical protein n=1 Tax=Collimonas antrihumi TaxID=1940615 RepID=UPI001B8CED68|nr:hypothetical protein [Collimonas antrihumi]
MLPLTEITVSDRNVLAMHVTDFVQAEIDRIVYCSSDLFIVSLAQPPLGNTPIHDHGFWAAIGIAEGCEKNAFYERSGAGLVGQSNRVRQIHLLAGHGFPYA